MDQTLSPLALEQVSAYAGALMALVQKHPDEPAYSEAYRRYHPSDQGMQEHLQPRVNKLRGEAS